MKFSFFLAILFLFGCASTPTGRKQIRYMPESQMATMGKTAFSEMKKKEKVLSTSNRKSKKVRCVVDLLLEAMNKNPSEWDVKVFEEKSPNAFALPGNHIGVYTGMMELVENNDQLAAVIGHEIAHVLAHHGNERVSQQLIVQGGLAATQVYLGNETGVDKTILGALGLGAQVGVLLPFSRLHETEADELGLKYMAKAGFDPRSASRLWVIMSEAGGASTPEFLSTHPNSLKRSKNLEKKSKKYIADYDENKNKSLVCQNI